MKASAPEAREEKGYGLLGKQEQPLSSTWTGSPFSPELFYLSGLVLAFFCKTKKIAS